MPNCPRAPLEGASPGGGGGGQAEDRQTEAGFYIYLDYIIMQRFERV